MPRGSILGPLFFILYVDDLNNASLLDVILFADDTNLFISHNAALRPYCHDLGPIFPSTALRQPHLCFCLHARIWQLYFIRSLSKRRIITVKLLKINKDTFRNTAYGKTIRNSLDHAISIISVSLKMEEADKGRLSIVSFALDFLY